MLEHSFGIRKQQAKRGQKIGFRDLAIGLRKRLGHWFRVVELMKMSASTSDAHIRQAYTNIGDYYIDRQNW